MSGFGWLREFSRPSRRAPTARIHAIDGSPDTGAENFGRGPEHGGRHRVMAVDYGRVFNFTFELGMELAGSL
jgi:hypothetical protein